MGFTVGIAGLGLIGGSAAKALHAYGDCRIFGMDISTKTLDEALHDGVLTGELTQETISLCDWIFVALYPVDTVKWVENHAQYISRNTVLIDLCGVKRNVCAGIAPLAKAHGFTYIGGHPMAGVARFGYLNADKDLFRGASMLLTPEEAPSEALKTRLVDLFRTMGFGFLKWTQPDEHDRMIAYTSQLAHVLSSAYAQSPSSARHIGFSAGSLRDMTRVATLKVDMWAELFLENREYLAEEVDALCARLDNYARALRENDRNAVSALLQCGCDAKRHMEEEEAHYAEGSHPDIQVL